MSDKPENPLRPIDEYHEDMGNVLWWKFPIEEPPYVGSPLSCGHTVYVSMESEFGEGVSNCMQVGGWPGYHTHFQEIEIPDAPAGKQNEE